MFNFFKKANQPVISISDKNSIMFNGYKIKIYLPRNNNPNSIYITIHLENEEIGYDFLEYNSFSKEWPYEDDFGERYTSLEKAVIAVAKYQIEEYKKRIAYTVVDNKKIKEDIKDLLGKTYID